MPENADLGPRHLVHPTTEGRTQQLVAEAESEIGLGPILDPFPDRLLFGFQPGMLGLLPDIHRPAHDPKRVIAFEIRDRLALVELDRVPGDAVLGEEVAEDARMLDRDVLEDQKTHVNHPVRAVEHAEAALRKGISRH
jgi:hypothetical protein